MGMNQNKEKVRQQRMEEELKLREAEEKEKRQTEEEERIKRQREEQERAQEQASNDKYDLPPEEDEEEQGKSGGISAIALYDYQAMADDEISFDPNDIITNIEMVDEGWWIGECRGKFGLFPANYVETLSEGQ